MTLDGKIGSRSVFYVLLALLSGISIWLERRWNPQPPRERYLRNPDDALVIAFWNVFSSKKWTEEGLTFHRKRLLFIPMFLGAFFLEWLVIDWLW